MCIWLSLEHVGEWRGLGKDWKTLCSSSSECVSGYRWNMLVNGEDWARTGKLSVHPAVNVYLAIVGACW